MDENRKSTKHCQNPNSNDFQRLVASPSDATRVLAACKALASQKSDEQKRGCLPPTTLFGAASQRRSRLEARRRCLVASGARTGPREAPQAKPLLLVPVGVAVA